MIFFPSGVKYGQKFAKTAEPARRRRGAAGSVRIASWDVSVRFRSMPQPIRDFIQHHYRHFNAAALVSAADDYEKHLAGGGKMFLTMAGAMSTAEIGLSLAEMIRRDKVHAITCTGANLEEDIFNLVAHEHYERVPHYRELRAEDEQRLLERHMNRVTDTCIPEGEAMRRIEAAVLRHWVDK